MVQWPPSPIVEDEAAALEKEHSPSSESVVAPPENSSVPSRGAVDQQPIIIESKTAEDTPSRSSSAPKEEPFSSKQESKIKRVRSSCDIEGKLAGSPPPDAAEEDGRILRSRMAHNKHSGERSKSATNRSEISEPTSRPPMPRLKTNVDDDLQRMKAGMRRSRSPYAYTRETGTFRVDQPPKPDEKSAIPQACTATTSAALNEAIKCVSNGRLSREYDSSTDSEKRTSRTSRQFESLEQPPIVPRRPRRTSTFTNDRTSEPEPQSIKRSSTSYLSPIDALPRMRESPQTSENESRKGDKEYKSRSRSRRRSPGVVESPYASSTDASSRREQSRSRRLSSTHVDRAQRRRSSNRPERPRFDESMSSTDSPAKPVLSGDEHTKHVYRIRDGRNPMTPPMVSTPRGIEDYFNKAFAENQARKNRFTPRTSLEDAIAFSPPTSPPRTPQAERTSSQDYFSFSASSPKSSQQRSRQPSWDDSQFKETKARTTLLSQATVTAAIAAHPSSNISRSPTTPSYTNSNIYMPPIKAKSRPPSPSRDSQRPAATRHASHLLPGFNDANRGITSTRDLNRDVHPTEQVGHSQRMIYHPQRNASWTGYNYHISPTSTSTSTSLNVPLQAHHTIATLPPSQQPAVPLLAQSSTDMSSRPARPNIELVLPPCPRSKPVAGQSDWYTFHEASSINICPTCANALANTKYRQTLMRQSYQSPQVAVSCALGNAWIRFVISNSLKPSSRSTDKIKKEVGLVNKLYQLPEDVWPCAGGERTVRVWWRLFDPETKRSVSDFHACSACISSVDTIFTELPDVFRREVINQERICTMDPTSKHFNNLVKYLDQVNSKCIERGRSKEHYIQPFVHEVRRCYIKEPECPRDAMLAYRGWHFMNNLPEFTVCECCYEEIVWPVRDKYIAKDISKMEKIVPGSKDGPPGKLDGSNAVSCQLYSERMRRIFRDAVSGKIPWEAFKAKVIERYTTQRRLLDMGRMYEMDQKLGWNRKEEIERNKQFWKSIE